MEAGGMKYKREAIYLLFSILLMGGGFNLFGCAGTEKWQEEVQLSDGRTIIVDRETLRERGGGEIVSNRSGTKPKEHLIRFGLPDGSGNMIEWRSTKLDDVRWPEIPLILDLESGHPIVYAIVFISDSCEVYSKYIFRNGIWSEEALPERFEERKTNLFLRDGIDMPKFVDLETKRKGNAEIGYPKSIRQVGPTRKICGSD
jgi:hypothetical protein